MILLRMMRQTFCSPWPLSHMMVSKRTRAMTATFCRWACGEEFVGCRAKKRGAMGAIPPSLAERRAATMRLAQLARVLRMASLVNMVAILGTSVLRFKTLRLEKNHKGVGRFLPPRREFCRGVPKQGRARPAIANVQSRHQQARC